MGGPDSSLPGEFPPSCLVGQIPTCERTFITHHFMFRPFTSALCYINEKGHWARSALADGLVFGISLATLGDADSLFTRHLWRVKFRATRPKFKDTDSLLTTPLLKEFQIPGRGRRGSGIYRATWDWSQRVVSTRILHRLQRPVTHQSRLQWIHPHTYFKL